MMISIEYLSKAAQVVADVSGAGIKVDGLDWAIQRNHGVRAVSTPDNSKFEKEDWKQRRTITIEKYIRIN